MTEMTGKAAVVIMLAVNSAQDIRKKEIFPVFTVIMTVSGIVFGIVSGDAALLQILISVMPGVFMAAFSFLTGGGAGLGDAIVLAAMGAWEEPQGAWAAFMLSLLFSSAAAIILIIKGKGGASLPFVPFLFAGYITMLVLF